MAAEPSNVKQNYQRDREAAVPSHIHLQLYASYVAQSMAFYFSSDDVALTGLADDFLRRSGTERERAEMMMRLQNQRGGRILLRPVPEPENGDWEGGLRALESAFYLAKSVNQSLLELHQPTAARDDAHLCHLLETWRPRVCSSRCSTSRSWASPDQPAQDGGPDASMAQYLHQLALGRGG
ncbi:ferritin heavy chain-like [Oryctolagus cuniculus]|uniref:ferritin heavy chain-like n=1 Tax=Oryctolagus cuniculus TaxID=9986 RepID=UPI00387927A9